MEREMEESIEADVDATILKNLRSEKRKKNVKGVTKKKTKQKRNEEARAAADDVENLPGSVKDQSNSPVGTTVSVFDHSVENFFKAVDTICKLSGDAEGDSFNKNDIKHLSSSITFLREWRYFSYPPRRIKFTCQSESPEKKDEIGWINLPPFSAAIVPKKEIQNENMTFPESSKDFIIYVGGPVWALDWCPKVHHKPDHRIKCEFVAISAHPPESSYHKIGTPLAGRGIVQVWCVLNASAEVDVPHPVKKKDECKASNSSVLVGSTETKKPRGRPRKKPINESACNLDGDGQVVPAEINSTEPKRPRGRPRKKPINESVDNLECNDQYVQAEIDSSQLKKLRGRHSTKPMNDSVNNLDCRGQRILPEIGSTQPKKSRGRPRKKPINESVDNFEQTPAAQFPEDSSELLCINWVPTEAQEHVGEKKSSIKCKDFNDIVSVDDSTLEVQMRTRRMKEKVMEESYIQVNGMPSLMENMNTESFQGDLQVCSSHGQDPFGSTESGAKNSASEACPSSNPIPEDVVLPIDEVPTETHEHVSKRKSARKKCKGFKEIESVDDSALKASSQRRRMKEKLGEEIFIHGNGMPSLAENENENSETFPTNPQEGLSCGKDPIGSCENGARPFSSETSPSCNPIPKDVALPRVVLCLAHNGKVAWDVKWRPVDVYDARSKHRMGYLAVLLGNGTLEVWEVPFPSAIKSIYSDCQKEGTDPRFIKLDPVFRCSKLMCGGRHSIPLTVEWSTSSAHDFILAGCHDGVVGLWKFSANCSSKDTRPLLCFSADTVPIRALAWAPAGSDSESANVIVTAGHRGLKFWDIRDPFRPLWDLSTVQRVIYSLDWLPDPRCIVVSLDDGTLRILSLVKAACDVPVTGKPFVGTQQQGFHSYYCSSFTIWNVQVSRLTGMVAYCSADGNVLRFQLTARAVERDHLRNRAPHFLCGSLIQEESALVVVSPVPDTPFPMKKSLNEWSNTPRTMRGFISVSNQAKRAKDQMVKGQASDDQVVALCYADDPGMEVGSDDASLPQMTKQKSKSIEGSNKKLKRDLALICRDEEPGSMHNEDDAKGDVGNSIEVFPPKMIAMHRVRWNVNKGSERWLCYGGAAGIVRCQEIDV